MKKNNDYFNSSESKKRLTSWIITIMGIFLIFLALTGFIDKSPLKTINLFNAPAPPRIGDEVWEDNNGNGIKDAGDFGLGNVVVNLYDNGGNLVQTTTTSTIAPIGKYFFEDVAPGDYYIEFLATGVDPNYVPTYADQGSDEGLDSDVTGANGAQTTDVFTVSAGYDNMEWDAGFYIEATIGDRMWEDQNANGIQDAGEPDVGAGFQVTLEGTLGTGAAYGPINTNTDATGNYSFTNVPPGDYKLTFDLGGFDAFTYKDEIGTEDTDSDVDEVTGETDIFTVVSQDVNWDTELDAGVYAYAQIGDYTWEDINANGIQDGNGPDLSGIDVTLNGTTGNGTAVSVTNTSSATGIYTFTQVIPGTYTLTFDEPAPYHRTYQDEVGTEDTDSDPDLVTGDAPQLTVISAQSVKNIDAGYYRYATISDYAWEDLNGNGIQDGNGPGVPGVDVMITGNTGNGTAIAAVTVSTDGAGNYLIPDIIPGNYTINFAIGTSTMNGITLKDQGGDDNLDSDPDQTTGDTDPIDVMSNDMLTNVDAGFYRYIHIGDFVWEDMNGNGIQEVGEPGLQDVKIELTRVSDGTIYNITTDINGNYLYDDAYQLLPGNYHLRFIPNLGYYIIDQDMTTDDLDSDPDPFSELTIDFTLESGEEDLKWDAGMYKPPTIGDYTWRDLNTDGLQNAGEPPMTNVIVELYNDATGLVVDNTITDAAGFYLFTDNRDAKPGDYYVQFEIPNTFLLTTQNAGAPELDSDPDQATGETDVFTVYSGIDTVDIDAGYYVEPPSDCPDDNAYDTCEEAPVLCELDQMNEFCTSMVAQNQQTAIPGCPPGTAFFHNPSWFAFVAGATNVSLIIHTFNCNGSGNTNGIQWGIYDDCDMQNPIQLQCPCVPPGDITVDLTGLIVGQSYHFFIDGCAGTQCTYWIEVTEGGGTPEVKIIGEQAIVCDDVFPDCNDICVGADVTFTLDEIVNAVTYIWTMNGVVDSTEVPDTTIHFSTPGTYTLCGYGKNACDIGDELCITFDVIKTPPEDLGQFDICENELDGGVTPGNWEGPPLYTDGKDSVLLTTSPQGCEYWQLIEIIKIPRDTVIIDTTACKDEDIEIGGETFTFDVIDYPVTDPGASDEGCDRIYMVTTHFIELTGHIESECSGLGDGSVKLTFFIEDSANVGTIVYQWFHDGYEIDNSNSDFIVIKEDGNYYIVATVTFHGVECVFDDLDDDDIIIDDFLPTTPDAYQWTTPICNNLDESFDYEIVNTNADYQYIWTYPTDLDYPPTISSDGTVISINWHGSAGGDLCVYAFDALCGSSDTICQTIVVTPAPNAEYTMQDTICLSSELNVVYTGNASANADYTWSFPGATETSGSGGVGQGPHTLVYNSPGLKIVSLDVNENGCLSETRLDSVIVQQPLQAPTVLCNSTATSVQFYWDDVQDSGNTTVEILTGQSGVLNGNTYDVTGLGPNEKVKIVIHFDSKTYCPGITDTTECQANNCDPVDIVITPADTSVCLDLDGNNPTFKLDYTITPTGGTVSWEGDGIVDTLTGLFNPDSAGIGTHTILLKYYRDGCYYPKPAKITVNEQPTSDFKIAFDTICISDEAVISYVGTAPSGSADWDFDFGDIISGSGLNEHHIKWNTSGKKKISLVVESNNCLSDSTFGYVFVQDTLDNVTISCAPSQDSIVYTWNLDPKAEGYIIYINGTKVDSAYINRWVINGLEPGDIVDISVIAVDRGICGNKSMFETCTARPCPKYKISISPFVDTLCLDDNSMPIQFIATIENSDGTGTIEWFGNGIDKDSGIFDPKIAGPGTHIINMKFNEVCPKDTTFTIEVIKRPKTELSVEKDRICISDSAVFTYFSNNPANTKYNWNISGGTFTTIDNSSFYVKWDTPGTYKVSLSTSNIICDGELKEFEVTVEPELIPPVIICNSTTNSIEITWDNVNCAESFNVFVDGVMVLNTTDVKYTLKDLDPNSSIDFIVEAVTKCECSSVSTEINCSTEPCPVITLEIENLPAQICVSDLDNPIQLNAKITGLNTGNVSWEGTGIDQNGILKLSGFNPGEYVYTLNYTVSQCDYSTMDTILITPLPYYKTSSIDPLCYNEENGGIIVTADEKYSYYLDGEFSDNPNFNNLAAGTYSLTVKDGYGCESTETITLTNPNAMEPSIFGPATISENSSGTYTIKNVDEFNLTSIVWRYNGGDTICSGSDCNSITIEIAEDKTLCLDIINDKGCEATTCIDIIYIENVDIDIPNIFSPDDDGLNDVFYITSDNTVESIKELKIFDRWGNLVFSQKDFPSNDKSYGWDGTYNGKKLNPGVFVYYAIFQLKARKDLKMVGDVTIIK